jgi:hypothetical protein
MSGGAIFNSVSARWQHRFDFEDESDSEQENPYLPKSAYESDWTTGHPYVHDQNSKDAGILRQRRTDYSQIAAARDRAADQHMQSLSLRRGFSILRRSAATTKMIELRFERIGRLIRGFRKFCRRLKHKKFKRLVRRIICRKVFRALRLYGGPNAEAPVAPIFSSVHAFACFMWIYCTLGMLPTMYPFPWEQLSTASQHVPVNFASRVRSFMVGRMKFPVKNIPLIVHGTALFDVYQLRHVFADWKLCVSVSKKKAKQEKFYLFDKFFRAWRMSSAYSVNLKLAERLLKQKFDLKRTKYLFSCWHRYRCLKWFADSRFNPRRYLRGFRQFFRHSYNRRMNRLLARRGFHHRCRRTSKLAVESWYQKTKFGALLSKLQKYKFSVENSRLVSGLGKPLSFLGYLVLQYGSIVWNTQDLSYAKLQKMSMFHACTRKLLLAFQQWKRRHRVHIAESVLVSYATAKRTRRKLLQALSRWRYFHVMWVRISRRLAKFVYRVNADLAPKILPTTAHGYNHQTETVIAHSGKNFVSEFVADCHSRTTMFSAFSTWQNRVRGVIAQFVLLKYAINWRKQRTTKSALRRLRRFARRLGRSTDLPVIFGKIGRSDAHKVFINSTLKPDKYITAFSSRSVRQDSKPSSAENDGHYGNTIRHGVHRLLNAATRASFGRPSGDVNFILLKRPKTTVEDAMHILYALSRTLLRWNRIADLFGAQRILGRCSQSHHYLRSIKISFCFWRRYVRVVRRHALRDGGPSHIRTLTDRKGRADNSTKAFDSFRAFPTRSLHSWNASPIHPLSTPQRHPASTAEHSLLYDEDGGDDRYLWGTMRSTNKREFLDTTARLSSLHAHHRHGNRHGSQHMLPSRGPRSRVSRIDRNNIKLAILSARKYLQWWHLWTSNQVRCKVIGSAMRKKCDKKAEKLMFRTWKINFKKVQSKHQRSNRIMCNYLQHQLRTNFLHWKRRYLERIRYQKLVFNHNKRILRANFRAWSIILKVCRFRSRFTGLVSRFILRKKKITAFYVWKQVTRLDIIITCVQRWIRGYLCRHGFKSGSQMKVRSRSSNRSPQLISVPAVIQHLNWFRVAFRKAVRHHCRHQRRAVFHLLLFHRLKQQRQRIRHVTRRYLERYKHYLVEVHYRSQIALHRGHKGRLLIPWQKLMGKLYLWRRLKQSAQHYVDAKKQRQLRNMLQLWKGVTALLTKHIRIGVQSSMLLWLKRKREWFDVMKRNTVTRRRRKQHAIYLVKLLRRKKFRSVILLQFIYSMRRRVALQIRQAQFYAKFRRFLLRRNVRRLWYRTVFLNRVKYQQMLNRQRLLKFKCLRNWVQLYLLPVMNYKMVAKFWRRKRCKAAWALWTQYRTGILHPHERKYQQARLCHMKHLLGSFFVKFEQRRCQRRRDRGDGRQLILSEGPVTIRMVKTTPTARYTLLLFKARKYFLLRLYRAVRRKRLSTEMHLKRRKRLWSLFSSSRVNQRQHSTLLPPIVIRNILIRLYQHRQHCRKQRVINLAISRQYSRQQMTSALKTWIRVHYHSRNRYMYRQRLRGVVVARLLRRAMYHWSRPWRHRKLLCVNRLRTKARLFFRRIKDLIDRRHGQLMQQSLHLNEERNPRHRRQASRGSRKSLGHTNSAKPFSGRSTVGKALTSSTSISRRLTSVSSSSFFTSNVKHFEPLIPQYGTHDWTDEERVCLRRSIRRLRREVFSHRAVRGVLQTITSFYYSNQAHKLLIFWKSLCKKTFILRRIRRRSLLLPTFRNWYQAFRSQSRQTYLLVTLRQRYFFRLFKTILHAWSLFTRRAQVLNRQVRLVAMKHVRGLKTYALLAWMHCFELKKYTLLSLKIHELQRLGYMRRVLHTWQSLALRSEMMTWQKVRVLIHSWKLRLAWKKRAYSAYIQAEQYDRRRKLLVVWKPLSRLCLRGRGGWKVAHFETNIWNQMKVYKSLHIWLQWTRRKVGKGEGAPYLPQNTHPPTPLQTFKSQRAFWNDISVPKTPSAGLGVAQTPTGNPDRIYPGSQDRTPQAAEAGGNFVASRLPTPSSTRPHSTRPSSTRPHSTRPSSTRPASTRQSSTRPSTSHQPTRVTNTPQGSLNHKQPKSNRVFFPDEEGDDGDGADPLREDSSIVSELSDDDGGPLRLSNLQQKNGTSKGQHPQNGGYFIELADNQLNNSGGKGELRSRRPNLHINTGAEDVGVHVQRQGKQVDDVPSRPPLSSKSRYTTPTAATTSRSSSTSKLPASRRGTPNANDVGTAGVKSRTATPQPSSRSSAAGDRGSPSAFNFDTVSELVRQSEGDAELRPELYVSADENDLITREFATSSFSDSQALQSSRAASRMTPRTNVATPRGWSRTPTPRAANQNSAPSRAPSPVGNHKRSSDEDDVYVSGDGVDDVVSPTDYVEYEYESDFDAGENFEMVSGGDAVDGSTPSSQRRPLSTKASFYGPSSRAVSRSTTPLKSRSASPAGFNHPVTPQLSSRSRKPSKYDMLSGYHPGPADVDQEAGGADRENAYNEEEYDINEEEYDIDEGFEMVHEDGDGGDGGGDSGDGGRSVLSAQKRPPSTRASFFGSSPRATTPAMRVTTPSKSRSASPAGFNRPFTPQLSNRSRKSSKHSLYSEDRPAEAGANEGADAVDNESAYYGSDVDENFEMVYEGDEGDDGDDGGLSTSSRPASTRASFFGSSARAMTPASRSTTPSRSRSASPAEYNRPITPQLSSRSRKPSQNDMFSYDYPEQATREEVADSIGRDDFYNEGEFEIDEGSEIVYDDDGGDSEPTPSSQRRPLSTRASFFGSTPRASAPASRSTTPSRSRSATPAEYNRPITPQLSSRSRKQPEYKTLSDIQPETENTATEMRTDDRGISGGGQGIAQRRHIPELHVNTAEDIDQISDIDNDEVDGGGSSGSDEDHSKYNLNSNRDHAASTAITPVAAPLSSVRSRRSISFSDYYQYQQSPMLTQRSNTLSLHTSPNSRHPSIFFPETPQRQQPASARTAASPAAGLRSSRSTAATPTYAATNLPSNRSSRHTVATSNYDHSGPRTNRSRTMTPASAGTPASTVTRPVADRSRAATPISARSESPVSQSRPQTPTYAVSGPPTPRSSRSGAVTPGQARSSSAPSRSRTPTPSPMEGPPTGRSSARQAASPLLSTNAGIASEEMRSLKRSKSMSALPVRSQSNPSGRSFSLAEPGESRAEQSELTLNTSSSMSVLPKGEMSSRSQAKTPRVIPDADTEPHANTNLEAQPLSRSNSMNALPSSTRSHHSFFPDDDTQDILEGRSLSGSGSVGEIPTSTRSVSSRYGSHTGTNTPRTPRTPRIPGTTPKIGTPPTPRTPRTPREAQEERVLSRPGSTGKILNVVTDDDPNMDADTILNTNTNANASSYRRDLFVNTNPNFSSPNTPRTSKSRPPSTGHYTTAAIEPFTPQNRPLSPQSTTPRGSSSSRSSVEVDKSPDNKTSSPNTPPTPKTPKSCLSMRSNKKPDLRIDTKMTRFADVESSLSSNTFSAPSSARSGGGGSRTPMMPLSTRSGQLSTRSTWTVDTLLSDRDAAALLDELNEFASRRAFLIWLRYAVVRSKHKRETMQLQCFAYWKDMTVKLSLIRSAFFERMYYLHRYMKLRYHFSKLCYVHELNKKSRFIMIVKNRNLATQVFDLMRRTAVFARSCRRFEAACMLRITFKTWIIKIRYMPAVEQTWLKRQALQMWADGLKSHRLFKKQSAGKALGGWKGLCIQKRMVYQVLRKKDKAQLMLLRR